MRNLRKTFHDNRLVWLGAKKERSELRPARLIHRSFEFISDLEAQRQQPMQVEKDLIHKVVKIGTNRCCFPLDGMLHFTHWAKQHFSQEELDMVKSFADAD